MITARAFAGKHYAVYGLARSGLATVDALLASGARVTAWDGNPDVIDSFRSSRAKSRDVGKGVSTSLATNGLVIADLDEADISEFDSLVVTPGLPLNRHPIAQRARGAGVEIIGDIELFARARPELPPHKVVGITGTNGKSTTTALIHHILQTAGVPSTMGGNIGLPILAQDPLTPNDKGVSVYVLELSSYQLDLTQRLDCDVAVLLNITADHLDRYESFEAYAASKARLFKMQSDGHTAIITGEDEASRAITEQVKKRIFPTLVDLWHPDGASIATSDEWTLFRGKRSTPNTLFFGSDQYGDMSQWPTLQGPHNAQNVVAAAAAFSSLLEPKMKVAERALGDALVSFPGLPHRMERVREKAGVTFVNDSKATNPTATAPALAAFPAIRWILGGQAKTDTLDECAPHFAHVRSAYTIGEAAELFERLLAPHMPVKNCGELGAAVRAAASDAASGDTVLLSPACASFDQYKDFEARGDAFRTLVGAL